MVELAVSILQEPAGFAAEDVALREYGIELLSHYSSVPLPEELRSYLPVTALPSDRGSADAMGPDPTEMECSEPDPYDEPVMPTPPPSE